MKIELSSVLIVLSIFAIIGGFLSWVLARFLTDKKDKLTIAFEIERIKGMISELKEDTCKIDPIQRKLDLIEERIKHL